MASILKLKGNEVSIASANNVSNANLVRVINAGALGPLTVSYANGTAYANCTLAQYESVIIEKGVTDTLTGTGMLGTPIAYRN